MSQLLFPFYAEQDFAYLEKQTGCKFVAGICEEGSLAIAGPLVATACILPVEAFFPELKECKTLSFSRMRALYHKITAHPKVIYAIEVLEEFDPQKIYEARSKLLLSAAESLSTPPDFFLVDGTSTPFTTSSKAILNGPMHSYTLAAAFILAKVVHGNIMDGHHARWPAYDFAKNKGFSTPDHLNTIKELGPSPIHRLFHSK